jgi:hypothetical protein
MNQINKNFQDKINLMNYKETKTNPCSGKHRESWTHHIMYRWLQIIQGLRSEKSHYWLPCELWTKPGNISRLSHIQHFKHFRWAPLQLWWYNCKCSANLFNAESFGALNSVKPAALFSVLTCMKMLCFKFSDILLFFVSWIPPQPS